MTLGITKYDSFRQIGQALSAVLTSIPEVGELLRQFLIQDIQNGWSHSDSNPNFRSAAVGFDNTRSKHTLHSISWLRLRASRCFCFFSQDFICSSLSSGLKGCKHCFPQVGHVSPWIWGHFSPRGQLPAAANEQIERSAGFRFLGSSTSSFSKESLHTDSGFHAVLLGGRKGLLSADSSGMTPGTLVIPLDVALEGWETDEEDEAADSDREGLTCSYLHRLP